MHAVLIGIAVFIAVGVVLALFSRRRSSKLIPESLFVVSADITGITLIDSKGNRSSVPWEAMRRVVIQTTDQGPFLPDVFWVIQPVEGEALIFPGGATGETEVLEALQQRLAGFRNDQVSAAMGSTSNAEFEVWERGGG